MKQVQFGLLISSISNFLHRLRIELRYELRSAAAFNGF